MHPREATQFNDKCACVLPTDHDGGCLCEHGIERVVYWIDFDGREHYVTRPLLPTVEGCSDPRGVAGR
jgi:hypothetical protein